MKFAEFRELVMLIRSFYPAEDFLKSKEVADAWFDVLKDLDHRRARDGMKKYAQENKWPPTIADIVRYHNMQPRFTQEQIMRAIEEGRKRDQQRG